MNSTKILLTLLVGFSLKMNSQDFTVAGSTRGENNQPEEDAIVQLLSAKDSSLVKTEITDNSGKYEFNGIKIGNYLVQVTAMNYGPYLSAPFEVTNSMTLTAISLIKKTVELKEVAVTTRKPFIEREKGKVILNIENSINASGSSVFEVIEKAPGVRVNNNDEVSLNGRPGTAIWVDGKPTQMTGSDLANYLRGIPSSAVEKIEIISNPSARYDAAGSSIINIIMKKDKRVGTNGSVSLAYGQGQYPKSNNSVSLNHRNKKFNVYGNYNYARRQVFSHLTLRREFSEQGLFLGAFNQDNYFKYDFNTHVGRVGADYYINKKNTLGIVLNGVSNIYNPTGDNKSEVYNSDNIQSSVFTTKSNNGNNRTNFSANLNYKHDFDSLGTNLVSDLDVAFFNGKSMQNIETRYLDLNYNETKTPYILYGDLLGDLDIYAFKNDFTKPLPNQFRFEAGQKSSFVTADNELSFYDRSNNQSKYDSSKSNHFIYTENINAAYINLNKEFKKWSLQFGTRFEHTSVTGLQKVYNTSFSRNYGQVFPSALITYRFNEKNSLEFNYSRRIRRPGYDQLNPFKFYLDPTTYREGNPFLQPSVTESFELTQTFKQQMTLSLGYGRTYRNIIEVIAPLTNQQAITVQTNVNLAIVDVFSLNGSIPYEIAKWWYTSNDFSIYGASYTGNVAQTPLIKAGNLTANFNTVNTFNLSESFSAELSVNKKPLKTNATLRLNINDIFFTNRITANVAYTDYREKFLVVRDTRVATLSFNYKFGKSSVPGARRRQGSAEDLQQRAGNGTG